MGLEGMLEQARDAMTVKRVFGDPIQQDGVTVIPAARVRGGGGGGGGEDSGRNAKGWGGGFGVMASPAGVYVTKDGDVTWRPAVNVNRIILGAQLVAIAFLLTIRSLAKANAKARAKAKD